MNVGVYFQDGKWTCEIVVTLGDGSTQVSQRPFESREAAISFAKAVMLGYKLADQRLSDPFLNIAEEWETED